MRYEFPGIPAEQVGQFCRHLLAMLEVQGVQVCDGLLLIDAAEGLEDELKEAIDAFVYVPDPAPFRAERNARLSDCDWTQLADAPLSAEGRQAWAAYRQALRDVPQQPGFPAAIVWPEQP